MLSKQQYNSMSTNYPAYLFTPGTAAAKAQEEASVAAAKAAVANSNGDFANAKAGYEAAVAKLQSAIDADATLNTPVEAALMGLISSAEPVVDAFAAKLNADAKQADGEASMYKNLGVFTILLGVATLLAGLGGILWAYSRLVEAKGPKQQQ
jgi:lysozyme family protein